MSSKHNEKGRKIFLRSENASVGDSVKRLLDSSESYQENMVEKMRKRDLFWIMWISLTVDVVK